MAVPKVLWTPFDFPSTKTQHNSSTEGLRPHRHCYGVRRRYLLHLIMQGGRSRKFSARRVMGSRCRAPAAWLGERCKTMQKEKDVDVWGVDR